MNFIRENKALVAGMSAVFIGAFMTSTGVILSNHRELLEAKPCVVGTSNGEPLQDSKCTPGATSSAVKQSNIQKTICMAGYSDTVRFSRTDAEAAKARVLKAYGLSGVDWSGYELDHLIPLSLGGTNDDKNLWPEKNDDAHKVKHGGYILNDKDAVERKLHDAVCSGSIKLRAAQKLIRTDWTDDQ